MFLDKSDYDQKIKALLSDQKTYKRLPRDPIPAFERRMNSLLLDLKKSGTLASPLYSHLRSSAGKIPLLYRLPKIQKFHYALLFHRLSKLPAFETPRPHTLPSGWQHPIICKEFHTVCWVHLPTIGFPMWNSIVLWCSPPVYQCPIGL